MQSFLVIFLLGLVDRCLAGKNVLYGYDVLMLTGDDNPAMMLVDENVKPFGDLGGTDLTYCVNVFLKSRDNQEYFMFLSYASGERNEMNEMYMQSSYKTKTTTICIQSQDVEFANAVPELDKWTHICYSWASSTGTINLYYDGVKVGSKSGIKKGRTIGGGGVLVLGQDQDKLGGGFDKADGMYGRMTQLNAWKRILTDDEVKTVYEGKMNGDLIDWRDSLWSLSGNAMVVDSESPNAAALKPVCTNDEPLGSTDLSTNEPLVSTDLSTNESVVSTDLSICLSYDGESCGKRESFVLFYYKTRIGTSQMSLTINDDKTTKITMGVETRTVPHLTVTPGWHHWCFVWSEESLKVYIDDGLYDVLTDFPEGTMLAIDGDLYLHEANSRNRFSSNVTDCKVWERALTKEEVLSTFKSCEKNKATLESTATNTDYYQSVNAYQNYPENYRKTAFPMARYVRKAPQKPYVNNPYFS